MFSFDKAKVLVVGAAGGIGRALALEVARRGARVVSADIDAEGAVQTAADISALGGSAIGVGCDVTDEPSLVPAVAAAEEFLGAIDVSLNVVGVLLSGNPEDIPITEWERIFQVNGSVQRDSTRSSCRRCSRAGKDTSSPRRPWRGCIRSRSRGCRTPRPKAALFSMSENLASYLKPKGIRASCLCPGPTITTIAGKASTWTEGVPLLGPGRAYALMTAERTAQVFCDGMEAERVIILAEERVSLDYMQRFAASPDDFIYERIGQYACGDDGLPKFDFADPEIAAAFKQTGRNG